MPVTSRKKNMDHKLNKFFIFDNRKLDSHWVLKNKQKTICQQKIKQCSTFGVKSEEHEDLVVPYSNKNVKILGNDGIC